MDIVKKINEQAGNKTGALPPAFQYRPLDLGVNVGEPDNTTLEFVNGQYTPIVNGEPYATEQQPNEPNEWNTTLWDDALKSGGKYIKIEDGETRVLKFMSNDPTVSINKFNRKAWDFDVMDENGEQKTISVTNVGLMTALYAMLPILYQNIAITRVGIGSLTRYNAKIIPNITNVTGGGF